jgi:nucleotide-binding universal stress UspA family protein
VETIVVGVDGSDASVNALRWALREARLRTARVRVVLAWSYPQVSTYHEAKHVLDVPFAEDAAAFLDQVVAETAAAAEGLEIEKKVVEGQAAPALVEAARDASLLVVGSRGLGGFSGLLLGSVSQQCAHHATCTLVIVREGTHA